MTVVRWRRWRRDDGFTAGGQMAVFGVLVFVMGGLLVLGAWQVVDAKFAAASAAREATRTFVESAADEQTARGRAVAAALEAIAGHGLEPSLVRRVTVEGALRRCARVRTEVVYEVPALVLPWIEGIAAIDVHADHGEIVDPLRSGLAGEATCVG